MTRRFVMSLLFVVLACAGVRAQDERMQAAPFNVMRSKLLVPIHLNGTGPYPFILDFGISRAVVAADVADYVGLVPVDGGASGGAVWAAFFSCGETTVAELDLLRMDLAPFTRLLGTPVAGVFSGRECANGLTIDFLKKSVALWDPDAPPLEADNKTLQFTENEARMPVIAALVGADHVVSVAVDLTFAGTVAIPRRSLCDWGLLTDATPLLTLKRGSSGVTPDSETQMRVSRVRVGPYEFVDPLIAVVDDAAPARLGLSFLNRFTVSLDFRSRSLRFESRQVPPFTEQPVIGVGLTPAEFDGQYWSVWIASGSPADRIGIHPGARLCAVNGQDAGGQSYAAVMALLSAKEGEPVSVTVEEEGTRETVILEAGKLL